MDLGHPPPFPRPSSPGGLKKKNSFSLSIHKQIRAENKKLRPPRATKIYYVLLVTWHYDFLSLDWYIYLNVNSYLLSFCYYLHIERLFYYIHQPRPVYYPITT